MKAVTGIVLLIFVVFLQFKRAELMEPDNNPFPHRVRPPPSNSPRPPSYIEDHHARPPSGAENAHPPHQEYNHPPYQLLHNHPAYQVYVRPPPSTFNRRFVLRNPDAGFTYENLQPLEHDRSVDQSSNVIGRDGLQSRQRPEVRPAQREPQRFAVNNPGGSSSVAAQEPHGNLYTSDSDGDTPETYAFRAPRSV